MHKPHNRSRHVTPNVALAPSIRDSISRIHTTARATDTICLDKVFIPTGCMREMALGSGDAHIEGNAKQDGDEALDQEQPTPATDAPQAIH